MTVFKAFLKVLNKCKVPIIMYTVFLVAFAGFNMQTNEESTSFASTKPDILIINNDVQEGLTKNLINYIMNNSNIKDIENDSEAVNDALFYRDVNYIVYIPKGYREDFLNGRNPIIEVKSTGDYQSSFAQMLISRYINVASLYQKNIDNEEKLMEQINNTLSKQVETVMTSKLDTEELQRASFYYNFANYSILAGCVYVICLILSSFKEEKISKRTIVSSMNYKSYNTKLLIANSLFAVVLCIFYVILSFILIGNVMFTVHGAIYIINSLVFTLCAVTIAFLIGNLINNKNAINGIVNVVALGSSFLCGAFVPVEWLPDSVLNIAHILPSYWYIQTNEVLKTLETVKVETLKPIFINIGMVMIFTLGFIIITNVVTIIKRKYK